MKTFRTIALHYRFKLLIKSVLISLAVLCILYAFTILVDLSFHYLVWTLLIIHVLIGAMLKTGIFSISESGLKLYFENKYPELENSLFLLDQQDQPISPVAQIQYQKVEKTWSALPQKMPVSFINSLVSLAFGALFLFVVLNFIAPQNSDREKNPTLALTDSLEQQTLTENLVKQPIIDPKVNLQVTVTPPAYTMLKAYQWDMERAIEEQSSLSWALAADNDLQQAKLRFSGNERNGKQISDKEFSWQFKLEASALFSLSYSTADSQYQMPLQRIGMIKDKPPVIKLQNEHLFFKEYEPEPGQSLQLQLSCTDDYGIIELQMVATLSRGKGENVQFKESKKTLFAQKKGTNKRVNSAYSISFDSLGLKSGDELYLHFLAHDNKSPGSQVTKSETYFLSIRDTSEIKWADASGIAVDAMPEYFRSQRQIIIDTEKLISKKNEFSKNEFTAASNEIGIDQKVLRLRYGQFLGEEFETTIAIDHAGHEHEHDHDEDDQDHHHDEMDDGVHPFVSDMQDHDHEESDLLEQYVHTHDVADVATFFDDAIKAQLKAALANMWEAELYLRIGEPHKALPYEYQALELIKEVQQKSRIYVERSGFKPAEINIKEKRLSADLSKVNPIALTNVDRKIKEELEPVYALIKQLSEYNNSKLVIEEQLIDQVSGIVSKALLEQSSRGIILLEQLLQFKQSLNKQHHVPQQAELIKNNLYLFIKSKRAVISTGNLVTESVINQRFAGKEGSNE